MNTVYATQRPIVLPSGKSRACVCCGKVREVKKATNPIPDLCFDCYYSGWFTTNPDFTSS